MVNALYDNGREGFLDGTLDWDTDAIRLALVATAYTVNIATHDFRDDLGANEVANSADFASKTVTAGTADAADIVLSSVSGSQVSYVVIYRNVGTAATDDLIAYIDTATNLPFTPTGGDVTVQWDSGSDRIFTL